MAHENGIERCEHPDFHGLHDWVAKRFGWDESTTGWCNIILKESGADDAKALDMFFERVDEYCHNIR
jgi:hypothetical protein